MRKKPKIPGDDAVSGKVPDSSLPTETTSPQEKPISTEPVSIGDWQRLYQAAGEFKKHKPWTWMENEDLFGVQNPFTGEIGYCCIMGTIKEVYGLGVYLGSAGLEICCKILNGELNQNDHNNVELLMAQKCLMVSFEDKTCLYQEDLDVIKKLGLKFRGTHAWPLFRSYEPGYFPWCLTANEVRFLTVALEQAVEVSLRAKNGKSFLAPKTKARYLVRVPHQEQNDTVWSDQYLAPVPLQETLVQPLPINEVRLQHTKQNSPQISSIWEIDRFYLPTPVRESSGRPYFPVIVLFVDQESYKILGFKLTAFMKSHMLGEYFLDIIDQTKAIPHQIHVDKPEVFDLLSPTTSCLGISLKMVRQFKALEEAKYSLTEFMEQQSRGRPTTEHQDQTKTKWQTKPKTGKRCGLCGKQGKLTKTPCCGNWICDDYDQYALFSYARNSCYRNHDRYTMCSVHYTEGHQAPDWRDCKECRKYCAKTEMYVWFSTNEYNFVKLENPPAYEPTRCAKCNKIIRLAEEGHSVTSEGYFCDRCYGR